MVGGGRISGKREARADILANGLASPHVAVAVRRMQKLIEDMQATLADRAWLAGDTYTLADAAFTPYIVRLDHLGLLGMVDAAPQVADWYRRCQQRASFEAAISLWLNPDYIALMSQSGREHWPTIKALMRA